MQSAWSSQSFRRTVAGIVLAVATGAAAAQEAPMPEGSQAGKPPTAGGGSGEGNPSKRGQPTPGQTGFKAGGAPGQQASKSKLEEMLDKALKNNPDLRVAAAKVQEADAELNRARLEVTRKVVRLHAAIDAAKKNVDAAQQHLMEVRGLTAAARASEGDLRTADSELGRAKSDLAAAEAEVSYIIGEQPGPKGLRPVTNNQEAVIIPLATGDLLWLTQLYDSRSRIQPQSAASAARPLDARLPDTMAAQIRKALNTTMSANYDGLPLTKVLKEFDSNFDLTFVARFRGEGPNVNLHLNSQPLGAVLQAIEDEAYCEFIVRDYGILVVSQSEPLPDNAVRVSGFWKRRFAPEGTPATKPSVKDADK
jgi:hypothetical protein